MPDERAALEKFLQQNGLVHTFPALKGGEGAVQLQRVMALKEKAREGETALEQALAEAGVTEPGDRRKLAGLLRQRLERQGGLKLKPPAAAVAPGETDAWRQALSDGGSLPEDVEKARPADDDGVPTLQVAPDGETWPAGMKLVNPQLARSIRAQGMLQEPNGFGYLHLAGEVERPRPFHKPSAAKREFLEKLKAKAKALIEAEPKAVRRADVFSAFIIPPGHNPGMTLIRERGYDVHIAEFDVVVLVECESPAEALRVRETAAFRAVKAELDGAARFVHCIAALNAKRIAEVDKTRDGVFLFNYFFAADIAAKGAAGIDVLLGVWEYTAGWWTAKVNLTNSTPLRPLPGELSQYSLINHCRWDSGLDVFPSLVFRPSLNQFVLANFTANDVVAMPVLYHLA
jgi:hypothetical protein